MSIESLKAQARRHEQSEEWQKALDQYGKAIAKLAEQDQPDSGLHNRVGDLYVKVGNYEKAIEHYDRAIELYRDAYLLNNAIAVCKKIVRHVPGRNEVYRTMGQIRAEQGFIPDARASFLSYAELMQEAGDLDESFRALVEFADLVRDDVDIRITVADQMLANDRTDDGVAQLKIAYQILKQSERDDRAFGLEARLLELDPEVDFDRLVAEAEELATAADDGFEYMKPFGEDDDEVSEPVTEVPEPIAGGLADDDALGDADALVEGAAGTEGDEALAEGLEEAPAPMADAVADAWEEEAGSEASDEEGEEAFDLPLVEGTEGLYGEPDEEGEELPLIDFGDPETTEASKEALTDRGEDPIGEAGEFALDVDVEEDTDEEIVELPGFDEPESESEAAAAPEPAAETNPITASDEYVDLGSMILGDERDEPRTTRFRVQYEEPSGDEAADFQKMLSQFKEKVSENLDASDVRAHHDLGTAYKEMGLLDEAIAEFQSALRASSDHLPTYELMGQTFLEMGKNEAAVKSLERALSVRPGVEDELLGIYYYLARAYEQLGKNESAVEYYDRVFSLDINFADVTERLRALR